MTEPGAGVDVDGLIQRRTLRVLFAGQVIGGGAIGVSASVAPLVAKEILGSATLAGLPFAAFSFGSAGGALLLSRIMARRGRRPGLVTGYILAAVGAASAIVATETDGFPLLVVGMALFGCGGAANLMSRYAAADLALPDARARAISRIVWATTVGAVAGPNVLGPSGRLATALTLPKLAGPFIVSLACLAAVTVVIGTLLRPDPMRVAGMLDARPPELGAAPPWWRAIPRSRQVVSALLTMALAHGVMVSVMTMTPLHVRDHGGSLTVVGLVISLHIAGMYAFAPIVGSAADRLGLMTVSRWAAAVLLLATTVAAMPGHHHWVIALALFTLGIGWSMAMITSSALVTAGTPPVDRARVQGLADMLVGLTAGIGGTAAGAIVSMVGYRGLAMAGFALVVVVAAVVHLWVSPPADRQLAVAGR